MRLCLCSVYSGQCSTQYGVWFLYGVRRGSKNVSSSVFDRCVSFEKTCLTLAVCAVCFPVWNRMSNIWEDAGLLVILRYLI